MYIEQSNKITHLLLAEELSVLLEHTIQSIMKKTQKNHSFISRDTTNK